MKHDFQICMQKLRYFVQLNEKKKYWTRKIFPHALAMCLNEKVGWTYQRRLIIVFIILQYCNQLLLARI